MKEVHALGGLWVRNAIPTDGGIRLDLSPSDNETRDFLRHINKLDATDGFEIDVPMEMLEHMILPDEVGTKEHKLAMLPGNCIDLRVTLTEDNMLVPIEGRHDASFILSGDEKTGFRPTPKFSRLLRSYIRDLSHGFVFSHVRGFFRSTHGSLVPEDETQALLPHQKSLTRILTPYSKHFCDDPSKVRQLNVAALDGNYLGVEQRINSVAGILEVEEDFSKQKPSSPIHGKITLSDMLGTAADNAWETGLREDLDSTLRNTRLGYAVRALDSHIRTKLTPNIVDHMSRSLHRSFTEQEKEAVAQAFQTFMIRLAEDSQKRMAPLDRFCNAVGQVSKTKPDLGLAAVNYLAGFGRSQEQLKFNLPDGTELDFGRALSGLFTDPRTFGAPLDSDPEKLQQAAHAVLLHYLSRELLSSYWELTNPTPSAESIDALLNETEQKVSDRFTKRKNPVPNPDAFYRDFLSARSLLVNQMQSYSGRSPEKHLLQPPRELGRRLLEKSAGQADVTRSRGLLLNSASMIFGEEKIDPDKLEALLKEGDLATGRKAGSFSEEVEYLSKAYYKSRAEAAFGLLLHAAISQNNTALAQRLDAFGEANIPKFHERLENELDARVRARTLTVSTLGKRVMDSPMEVYKALNPRAQVKCEMAYAKASVVSSAAMNVLRQTLRRSLSFYRQSLPSDIELNNIESTVYNGPQSAKMVEELVEETMEHAMLDYFRLSSIRDPAQRERSMDAHAAMLAEKSSRSKAAVEIEADSRCYPGGLSPRRQAKQLLKDAFNKALMGKGGGQINPHLFAPPSL